MVTPFLLISMNHGYTFVMIYAGVIRQYRIRVVALDQSGFERTYITSSTIELINDLECCTSYEFSVSAFTIGYGSPTPTRNIFKTQPDIVTSKCIQICSLLSKVTSNISQHDCKVLTFHVQIH